MLAVVARIAGVCCICYWGYAVLYGGVGTEILYRTRSALETVQFLGIEFTHNQLKMVFFTLLLPLGLLLWAIGDYRPSNIRKRLDKTGKEYS